jgi:hypothetical protein
MSCSLVNILFTSRPVPTRFLVGAINNLPGHYDSFTNGGKIFVSKVTKTGLKEG